MKLSKEDIKYSLQTVFEDEVLNAVEDFNFYNANIDDKIDGIIVTYSVVEIIFEKTVKKAREELKEDITYDRLDLYKAIYELTNDNIDEEKENLICTLLCAATKDIVKVLKEHAKD